MKYRSNPQFLFAALLSLAMLFPSLTKAADLMEIYQIATQKDAQIRAAAAQLSAQLELIPQSRAALLPNVSISGNTRKFDREATFDEEFNSNGYSAQVTQPIFRADRWYQLKLSEAAGQQAVALYDAAEQNLVLRVATAYFNVLRSEDNLSSAVAAEAAFQRQLEQTQERFDVGLIAITDVHEAQAAYDLARVTRITEEEQRDNSFAALETLTDQQFLNLESLDSSIPIESPEPAALQEWISIATAGNADLDASRFQVETARQEIKRQKSGHLPTLDVVASYSHDKQGGTNFFGNETNTKIVGLEFNLPLFQGGGTRSRVREAQYLLNLAKENYESQYRLVKQNIQTQHRTVSSDVLRVGAQALALRSSQSALEATEGGYEVGTRNIVDVLQAQSNLFRSQRDYANSVYDYIINKLELDRIAGTLSQQQLQTLNQYLVEKPAAGP